MGLSRTRALANELAAQFYLKRAASKKWRNLISVTHVTVICVGAHWARCKQLDEHYPAIEEQAALRPTDHDRHVG